MKNIIIIAIGLIGLNALGQKSVRINQDIDALKVSAGIQIELFTDANENKIVANGQVFEAINYKIRDNQLRISSRIEALIEGDVPLKLKVYIKNLSKLNVVQGSAVELQNKFEADQLTLRAGEGSTISGELEVNSLEVTVLSGGLIDMKGVVETQGVEIKTGGEYRGRYLKTENTTVKISYGGEAQVFASKNCGAKVIAGGTIDIFGNPEFLNEKRNFGGEINLK